jgi:hypothetical protein
MADSRVRPRRIEGYAIVSEDGMLANAAGIMPDSLKFEVDRQFFERELDAVDVVVHGRHSREQQPRSYLRRRLILTRQVPSIAADPSNEKALFWNPAGASFEQALAALGTPDGRVGIIGGTDAPAQSFSRSGRWQSAVSFSTSPVVSLATLRHGATMHSCC